MSLKFKYSPQTFGFTLIEMMVTVGIFALITSAVFLSQGRFSGSTLLTNVAYEVALTLRQAQVYGLSVREFTTGGFNYPYGVHFSTGLPNNIVFFVDTTTPAPAALPQFSGSISSCGPTNNCLDLLTLHSGNTVSSLCISTDGTSYSCGKSNLNISFVRPDPEARIVSEGATYVGACVLLSSAQSGLTRSIKVTNTGQISVNSTCP